MYILGLWAYGSVSYYFTASLCYIEKDFAISKHVSSTNDEFYKNLGIKIKKFSVVKEEDICIKIDGGNAVVVGVDCFELPIRADHYLKKHVQHFILVYGYDTERRIFQIVEHNYVNSRQFIKRELDFDSLIKACISYDCFCNKRKDKRNSREIVKGSAVYKNLLPNFLSRQDCLVQSIEAAEANLTKFIEIFDSGYDKLIESYPKIISYFDDVSKLKYNLFRALEAKSCEISFLADKLVSGYKFLMTVLWKINRINDRQPLTEKKEKIFTKVKTLINDEKIFHEMLINLGEENYA